MRQARKGAIQFKRELILGQKRFGGTFKKRAVARFSFRSLSERYFWLKISGILKLLRLHDESSSTLRAHESDGKTSRRDRWLFRSERVARCRPRVATFVW